MNTRNVCLPPEPRRGGNTIHWRASSFGQKMAGRHIAQLPRRRAPGEGLAQRDAIRRPSVLPTFSCL
jgi:hypothetical protein